MEIKQIKQLKAGEFFHLVTKAGVGKAVYVRDEYDRHEKKYMAYAYYDVNYWRYFKPSQLVEVGFEF